MLALGYGECTRSGDPFEPMLALIMENDKVNYRQWIITRGRMDKKKILKSPRMLALGMCSEIVNVFVSVILLSLCLLNSSKD